jgi:hypothetical protein
MIYFLNTILKYCNAPVQSIFMAHIRNVVHFPSTGYLARPIVGYYRIHCPASPSVTSSHNAGYYGYSRPRLSIRDIITQCGYSVRYRPQASPLQGNAGRDTRYFPGSSAKHHSIISFGYRLSSMHSARRTGVLRQGGRRVKVVWIRFVHTPSGYPSHIDDSVFPRSYSMGE